MYNMKTIFVVVVLAAVTGAQNRHNGDPRTAAILSEQRFQSGDGTFGTQYKQEDGVEFKEESDALGNRKGSYSYVDANGQKKTVHYTAGKDGFMATGDHLPQAAVPPPQYTPDPKYNPPAYQEPDQYQYQEPQQQQYQQPQQQYQQPQQQYQQPQQQYQQPKAQYQPQPQYQPRPQPQYQPQPQPQPQYRPQPQPQYQPQPQPQYRPQPQYQPTTEAPHRFYPPGKLSLQRSPDGYAYSFNKA